MLSMMITLILHDHKNGQSSLCARSLHKGNNNKFYCDKNGLEDQLLARVVKAERPDIEHKKTIW